MDRYTSDTIGTDMIVRRLTDADSHSVYAYLQSLSPQTKKRFGPHAFDEETVMNVLNDTGNMIAYGAFETETNLMIAYSLIKFGWISFDKDRLINYGLELHEITDCTFAPSVADSWQNKKVGSLVFNFILSDLPANFNRIILWGGVQADNAIALNFYMRKNFHMLGMFEHHGNNYDMILTR